MLKTVRTEKVDEKNGVICLVYIFPFLELWSVNFPKKIKFLQSCADLSKHI